VTVGFWGPTPIPMRLDGSGPPGPPGPLGPQPPEHDDAAGTRASDVAMSRFRYLTPTI